MVISRRRFITGLVIALTPPGATARAQEYKAQQAAKVARIGWRAGNLAPSPQLPEAFRQGLRDLGYVEGRNLVIESRSAEGKLERFPALAAELVALKVDVIVTASVPAGLAAKQATRTLPGPSAPCSLAIHRRSCRGELVRRPLGHAKNPLEMFERVRAEPPPVRGPLSGSAVAQGEHNNSARPFS
jgi:hypothetical protein